MRKFSFVLSLSVILAVLIAGCGSSSNATPTPTPTYTPAPLPTTSSLATQPSSLPGTGGGAASGTATAPSAGTPSAAGASTSTPGGLANTGNGYNISQLSNMLTFPVVDQNDNQIGTVNDLVLNLCTAHVDYVIVTLNGNLPSAAPGATSTATAAPDMASTGTPVAPGSAAATATGANSAGSVIAIPWDVLSVVNENSYFNSTGASATVTATATAPASFAASGSGEFILAHTVTSDMLLNAPTFDKTSDTQDGVFNSDWDTALRSYWGLTNRIMTPAGCVATGATGSATSTVVAPGNSSTSTAVAPGSITGTPAANSTANPVLTGIDLTILAHSFLTSTVNDQSGNNVGSISDGIVVPNSGLIRFLVLNPSTSLNISGKLIPVPIFAFSYNKGAMSAFGVAGTATPTAGANMSATGSSNIVLTLKVPISLLQNAPTLDPNNMPDMTVPGWDVSILNYWSNQKVAVP